MDSTHPPERPARRRQVATPIRKEAKHENFKRIDWIFAPRLLVALSRLHGGAELCAAATARRRRHFAARIMPRSQATAKTRSAIEAVGCRLSTSLNFRN